MKSTELKNRRTAFTGLSLRVFLSLLFLIVTPGLFSTVSSQETGESAAESFLFPDKQWERYEDPAEAGYTAAGLEEVRAYTQSLDTTGLLVVVGGKVIFEYGNIEELSYLASCRKSVLSMLYGKYVEDGTIRLNMTLEELGIDDIGGLLPIEKKATIDHLITARSGIYHKASNSGDSTEFAPFRGSKEPGSYMLYNNWDFNCAGSIFELLTHQTIYDAVERDLAGPLGMQDYDRLRQRKSGDMSRSKYPAYHMWYSTRDMARIGYLMLRKGNWNGKQIIPERWVERTTRARTPVEHMNPDPYREGLFGYGYMWWVCDGPRVPESYKGAYLANGAYGQFIAILPALDMVIAHKTAVPPYNRRTSTAQFRGIIDRLIAARRQIS